MGHRTTMLLTRPHRLQRRPELDRQPRDFYSCLGVGEREHGAALEGIDDEVPLLVHDGTIGTNPGRGIIQGARHDHFPELHLPIPAPLGIETVCHGVELLLNVDHRFEICCWFLLVDDETGTNSGRVRLSDRERPR